jgi:hypothetical protein
MTSSIDYIAKLRREMEADKRPTYLPPTDPKKAAAMRRKWKKFFDRFNSIVK